MFENGTTEKQAPEYKDLKTPLSPFPCGRGKFNILKTGMGTKVAVNCFHLYSHFIFIGPNKVLLRMRITLPTTGLESVLQRFLCFLQSCAWRWF